MRKRVLLYLWGQALLAFGASMLIPFFYSFFAEDSNPWVFSLPMVLSIIASYRLAWHANSGGYNGRITIREGAALIGLSFLSFCFLGMVPFLFTGIPFIDALFESVSGFTTTGASALGDLRLIPSNLLFWRSLSQWMGGLGIVLIFITLVPQVGRNAAGLFIGEIYGESAERMLPRMKEIVKTLLELYVAFTALVIGALWLAGMTGFEALNYAMSMVSSGGFAMHNEGIAYFHSHVIYGIALITMFIAGGNYVLYFRYYKSKNMRLWQDSEYKAYVVIILVGTILVGYNLGFTGTYSLPESLMRAISQVVAVTSTTGFIMADYPNWPDFSKLVLFCLMFVGGCSGSAAGGLKISRLVILLKTTWVELKRTLHPRMVTNIVLSGINVTATLGGTIFRFFFLYTFTFFMSATLLVLADDLSMFGAATVALSCLSGTGSGFEVVCGMTGYGALNIGAKMVCIATMLLGRMEIFSLCVLFYPAFWEKGK